MDLQNDAFGFWVIDLVFHREKEKVDFLTRRIMPRD